MREVDSFIHSRIENMVNQGEVDVDENCRREGLTIPLRVSLLSYRTDRNRRTEKCITVIKICLEKENFLNTLKSLLRIKYKVYFFFCNSFIAIDKVELSVNLDICNGKGGKVIATARNWFICKSNHVVVSDEVTYH